MSAIGIFYGLVLGLIAVTAWEGLSEFSHLVSEEATTVGMLYRDVGGYPPKERDAVRAAAISYVHTVIDEEWPDMEQGRTRFHVSDELNGLFEVIYSFEPEGDAQATIHAEVLDVLNHLMDCRRRRLSTTQTGLPMTLWLVVIVGAFLTLGTTSFFRIDDTRLHRILNGFLGLMIGLLIYVIAAMDHPYWGVLGATPQPFHVLLHVAPTVRP